MADEPVIPDSKSVQEMKRWSTLVAEANNNLDKYGKFTIELVSLLGDFGGALDKVNGELEGLNLISQSTREGLSSLADGFGDLTFAAIAQEGAIQGLMKTLPIFGQGLADVTKRQFESATAFSQLTQTGGNFGDMVHEVTTDLAGLGLSAEDISTGLVELYDIFTDFAIDGVSSSEKELARLVGRMKSVGVGSSGVVKSMQSLKKGFLLSNEEIEKTILELEAFAEASGQSSDKLIQSFSEQAATFAVYGDTGVEVFKELSAAARSSGLEMDSMLEIAKGFDRFDSAASSVANLNQLLGGPYLNTIEFIQETDPTERMRMLSQAFDMAGQSVEDMGYYAKQAFVEAIPGINDVEQLTKLQIGDFDRLTQTIDAAGKSTDELQAKAYAQMSPADAQKAFLEASATAAGLVPQFQAITQDGLLPMVGGNR